MTTSGVANTGGKGYSVPLDSEKFPKNLKKEGKNQEKSEKRGKKSGKRGKIETKRQKSGRFFHFAPPDR